MSSTFDSEGSTSDQAWFWTDRWQKMEAEADADIEAGRVLSFESVDAMLASLNDD